jgi:LemA protein
MDSLPLAIALGAFFIWALVIYNRLVALRGGVRAALAAIEVELQRRRDLVPNLLETVRVGVAHEHEALQAVAAARETANAAASAIARDSAGPQVMADRAQAEGALSVALNRLLAHAESLPELKADQSLAQLAREVAEIENRLAAARQAYNEAVREYNAAQQAFPAVMFASTLGFKPAPPLDRP